MTILDKVKDHFYLQGLHKDILHARKTSPFVHLHRIIILTRLESEKERDMVVQWAEQWHNTSGNVTLVQRVKQKDGPEYCQDTLKASDLTWTGIPKAEKLSIYKRDHFDLLINLDTTRDKAMEYLSAAIHADMKVGLVENPLKIYDLLIDSEDRTRTEQLQSIQEIIEKLIVP